VNRDVQVGPLSACQRGGEGGGTTGDEQECASCDPTC